MRKIETISWGTLLAFGAFVIYQSLQHNYYGSDFGPGPGFFSFWLGILLMVLSLAQIVMVYRRPAASLPAGFFPDREGILRIASILVALAAALVLMTLLGFSLTIMGFCIFLLRKLGRQPWWLTLVLALAASFGTHYLFGLLQVMLPKGILGFI
jgi:hypothetical protein